MIIDPGDAYSRGTLQSLLYDKVAELFCDVADLYETQPGARILVPAPELHDIGFNREKLKGKDHTGSHEYTRRDDNTWKCKHCEKQL